MRTTLRRLAAGTGLAIGLIAVIVGSAAADHGCRLTVSPRSGPPGTEFVFKGHGFLLLTQDELTLTRNGTKRVVPVLVGAGGGFKLRLIATKADAGRWRVAGVSCGDTAAFTVTLPPTASPIAAPLDPVDRTPAIIAFGLMGALFLASSVVLLPRLSRRVGVR